MLAVPRLRAPPYAALARVYDVALGRRFFRQAARGYRAVAERYGIAPRVAADLGAGTGLFARWLARRTGARVFAVERSPAMLAIAARRSRGTTVVPLRQDIRALSLPEPVDLAVANYDTINHLLTPADVNTAFAAIRNAVRPGGFFLFDVISTGQSPRPIRYRCRVGVTRFTQLTRYDPARRLLRVVVHLRRLRPACHVVERHLERIYPLTDLSRWLRRAGFRVRELLDAYTLRPLSPGLCSTPRVLIVAQRPPER